MMLNAVHDDSPATTDCRLNGARDSADVFWIHGDGQWATIVSDLLPRVLQTRKYYKSIQ